MSLTVNLIRLRYRLWRLDQAELRAEGIESALTMARAFRLADTFTEEDQ